MIDLISVSNINTNNYEDKLKQKYNRLINDENLNKYYFELKENMILRRLKTSNYRDKAKLCDNFDCNNQVQKKNKLCRTCNLIIINSSNQELVKRKELLENNPELNKLYIFDIKDNRIRRHLIESNSKVKVWQYLCTNVDCNFMCIKSTDLICRNCEKIKNNPVDKNLLQYLNNKLEILQDIYKDLYDFRINNSKMIQIKKKNDRFFTNHICMGKNCIIRPGFNYPNETERLYCVNCKLDGMVDISHKNLMCIICNLTRATYNYEEEEVALYCSMCKNDKMININDKNRRCKNVIDGEKCKTLAVQKKYDGYCFDCYFILNPEKIPIINRKIKENNVVKFIKENYNLDFKYDKYVGNTNKKPDILLELSNFILIIEVDEYQHKKENQSGQKYSPENEKIRNELILNYFNNEKNKKVVFIRFNPDDYIDKNKTKINSPWDLNDDRKMIVIDKNEWNNRLKILKQKIDFYLKKKVIKNNSTNYLFYDKN